MLTGGMGSALTPTGATKIRFIDNPFLGRTIAYTLQLTVLPTSRLRVNLALDSTHFTDPRTETRAFDVKIARSFTTY